MSAEKLKNTKLANMDSKILTREKSKNLGITSSKNLQKCTGNKITSMDILNNALSTLPGICSNCKSKNSISIISVHGDPRFRYGLSEKLLFHCSDCNKYITFSSSKTTNSRFSSAYEINIRSVLASISIGRAGLSKFCSTIWTYHLLLLHRVTITF